MTGRAATKHTAAELYRRSLEDPIAFWGKAARQFHWYRKWDKVLDDSRPPFYRWFAGGKTNLCYNAVDRHVKDGLADRPAFIWEGAAQGITRVITYGELHREVNRFAGVLKSLGVEKGDRVLMFMPNVPETAYAMLACVRIGAMHASVFTGYGIDNITERIHSARPKIALTADGSFRRNRVVPLKETLDIAMKRAPIDRVVVLNRGIAPAPMTAGRDLDWATLVRENRTDYVEPEVLESGHPSHIVFTSGDTGNPRGVVNDTGGLMVGLGNSMGTIYGVKPGDVFWATSDIGWRLGHNYIVYGPLLYGVTSLIFEGTPDFPDHEVYWRLIQKHRVNVIFSVPTVFKMLKRFGIEHARKYDISPVRYLFLAGEYCDADTWKWSTEALNGIPVIDHYWLTEAGWPMTSQTAGVEIEPFKPGYANKATIGWDLDVVDQRGNPVAAGKKGILVAKPPLPPGNIDTLWNANGFYEQEYWRRFPGKLLFLCGDYATRDEDGYIAIGSRVDEVINIAAHRVSTGEIAAVIATHPSVADVCCIGVADVLKGEEAVALVVLKPGTEPSAQLKTELRNSVRERVGAIAAPKDIHFVPSLAKDRQGRHMRAVFKAVFDSTRMDDSVCEGVDATPDEIKAAADILRKALNAKR